MLTRFAGAIALLILAGCASLPQDIAPPSACRILFEDLDREIAAAGIADGGARKIAGFPYLRVNRWLASFRAETHDAERFSVWVSGLQELDRQARRAELANLRGHLDIGDELFRLDDCAARLIAGELRTPGARQRLRERAVVASDYSITARVFGLYPLALPFLKLGISSFQREVREDFAAPLEPAGAGRSLVLWQNAERATRDFVNGARLAREAPRNALGIPELSEHAWIELFNLHAPAFLVETAGDTDRLGTPVWRDGRIALDLETPRIFLQPAYTRYGEEILLQLVYVIWFAERPREGLIDSYAGRLDGLIWRVTLGPQGFPLVHDSIHPCGCYHYLFPVEELKLKDSGGFLQEGVMAPQGRTPWWQIAVRLESGTHYVQRVLPLAEAHADTQHSVPIVAYNALRSLPDGAGRRSLFQPNGMVAGTQRGERLWLWPSGVRNPGAMRQWGRHATSFVGQRHFDEPRLLEELLELPR